MSNAYALGSQISSQPTNIVMANVTGVGGEGKLSIKPIEQYYVFYIKSVQPNTETSINLTSVNFDYIVKSIWWSNTGNSAASSDVIFRIYEGNNVIGRLDLNATFLSNGLSLQDKPYPLLSSYRVTVTSEFLIDRLTFVVEPVIVLQNLNVGG